MLMPNRKHSASRRTEMTAERVANSYRRRLKNAIDIMVDASKVKYDAEKSYKAAKSDVDELMVSNGLVTFHYSETQDYNQTGQNRKSINSEKLTAALLDKGLSAEDIKDVLLFSTDVTTTTFFKLEKRKKR